MCRNSFSGAGQAERKGLAWAQQGRPSGNTEEAAWGAGKGWEIIHWANTSSLSAFLHFMLPLDISHGRHPERERWRYDRSYSGRALPVGLERIMEGVEGRGWDAEKSIEDYFSGGRELTVSGWMGGFSSAFREVAFGNENPNPVDQETALVEPTDFNVLQILFYIECPTKEIENIRLIQGIINKGLTTGPV